MEVLLQGVLQQHEDRIVALLDDHHQRVADAVKQQLAELDFSTLVPKETAQRRLQRSDARGSNGSLTSESAQSTGRSLARLPRVHQSETMSQVSETLRRGESEVWNWLERGSQPNNCCADSVCYGNIRKCCTRLYKARWFEWSISLAILSNAVLLGIAAELSLTKLDEPLPPWFHITNVCFLVVFATEISIRWIVESCYFLNPTNKNFVWNIFDLLLVLSALAEEVLDFLSTPALNVSFMRLARVLRLMRVTRVLRVLKQFKELRIMVHGMLNCGKPLLWAALLLGLLAYMYVVFCLQISSEWLRTLPPKSSVGDPNYPQGVVDFILSNFGSLRYGMYTLLKCITGGVSWEEVADPLMEVSPILLGGFLLYVLFGLACLLNLITAVFLEAAYERSHSEETQLLEHIEKKRVWIRDAKYFFHTEFLAHFGGRSTSMVQHEVDLEEFTQILQAPRVRAWFEEHGLDVYFEDPKSLFELIDVDSDHQVDMHEFVVGLYRLKGGASALNLQLELQQILSEIKSLKKNRAEAPSEIRGAQSVDAIQVAATRLGPEATSRRSLSTLGEVPFESAGKWTPTS